MPSTRAQRRNIRVVSWYALKSPAWFRITDKYVHVSELKSLGDIISFGPNAGRIFRRWSNGAVVDRMTPLSINLENHGFKIHKWTGELVHTQLAHKPNPEAPVFNGHRGELHTVVFNHAKDDLGIPIHLGQRVTKYFEDETQAGIVFENGNKVMFLKSLGQ